MNETILLWSVGGVLVLIFILALVGRFSAGTQSKSNWKTKIKKHLNTLDGKIHSDSYDIRMSALIQVDKLLDNALKAQNVPGRSLGERLKKSRGKFDRQTYNAVWEAHKLRNKLVHELEYKTTKEVLLSEYRNLKKGVLQVCK